jgi:hypothetical protein
MTSLIGEKRVVITVDVAKYRAFMIEAFARLFADLRKT